MHARIAGILATVPSNPAADRTNALIIDELQRDGRVTFAELGRRVGLSAPAVAERVQRLEDDGVILGYRAIVDPRAVGFALSAIIRVRPAPDRLKTVADVARKTAEVVECHRVTGDDCYVMKVHLRDVVHLEEVIDRFAALGQTTSSIMQSSPVAERPLATTLEA
jgi:Lrp/AsnC family transcriptional regulator, leucine-responsive regulatory protein